MCVKVICVTAASAGKMVRLDVFGGITLDPLT